jgi:hypothetical protein
MENLLQHLATGNAVQLSLTDRLENRTAGGAMWAIGSDRVEETLASRKSRATAVLDFLL